MAETTNPASAIAPRRRLSAGSFFGRSALHRSAQEWRVGSRLAWTLFLVPLAGTLVIFASRVSDRLFFFLTREDGPLEWTQVAGSVTAAVFALATALLLRGRGDYLVAALYGLFAAGCVFLAGEEISWGQRLFGLETPSRLREVNVQEELTVHNILPCEPP